MHMKRDMDLVRFLLLITEEAEEPFDPRTLDEFSEYSENILVYHVELLENKGLIDVNIQGSFSGSCMLCEILGLTWDGADYLDAIRNDKVWDKTKKVIKKTVGSTTMEIIKNTALTVATQCIAKSLGI